MRSLDATSPDAAPAPPPPAADLIAVLDRLVDRIAAATALCGMGMLALLALFVCGAVVARVGFDAPATGDVEIVEAVCAVALYACLPWRRARRADAAVDLLTRRLPNWGRRGSDVAAAAVDAALALLIAWRLAYGARDAWTSGDVSTALGVPLWWSYAAMQPVSLTLVVVSCWLCARAILRPEPDGSASDHD